MFILIITVELLSKLEHEVLVL